MYSYLIFFFNQTKQTATKFEGLEKKRRINQTVWVNSNGYLSSSALHIRYILTNCSAFSTSKLFLILEHTTSYIEKIHSIDAELAVQAHKLDVKLQSLCGSGFSLFAVRMLDKPYHLGVNWPTTHCKIKDGIHFFTRNFECHNRYNKLLLCNSENIDIAWWNKNNSEWGFSVFFEKRTKPCFFKKKQVF